MNKVFSFFMLSAVLLTTSGCGNKKKATVATPMPSTQESVVSAKSVATDSKEDYTFVA